MDVLKLVPFDSYSDDQKLILTVKANNPALSYKNISLLFADKTGRVIHDRDIVTCMMDSALGFIWNKNTNKSGRHPYLCPADTNKLHESSLAIAHESSGTLDPSFIDLAVDIKTARLINATRFLWKVGCKKLALKIREEEKAEPTRS